MDKEQIFELVDDDGKVEEFSVYDSFQFDEKKYVILLDSNEDAILFRVEGEEDNYTFVRPDEEEFEKISEVYYGSE